MSLKSFEFTSHEESRWNGNYFSRTIFWENMQLDLLGGIFFKKQQTGGPNNKTRIGSKMEKRSFCTGEYIVKYEH